MSAASQRLHLHPDRARASSLRQPRFPLHPVSPPRPPRNLSPVPARGANDHDGPSVPPRRQQRSIHAVRPGARTAVRPPVA